MVHHIVCAVSQISESFRKICLKETANQAFCGWVDDGWKGDLAGENLNKENEGIVRQFAIRR